jgi:hypothetical protein
MVRGPRMTEVTAGWATGKATASDGSEQPRSAASAASDSIASNFAAFSGNEASKCPRRRTGRPADRSAAEPREYRPVSRPKASGLQVSTPMP